jgi:hypothetical protein
MTHLHYFNQSRVALNMEVKFHPPLMELLAIYSMSDFEGKLGEIALYCGIEIDGYYADGALDKMCQVLYHELQLKRKVILH